MYIENSDYHVLPLHDLKRHYDSPDCPCNPTFDDMCWIHHSFDKRERLEARGRRRPNKLWFVICDGKIIGLKGKAQYHYDNFEHYPRED